MFVEFTPGTRLIPPFTVRATGNEFRTSALLTNWLRVPCTSTTGDAPVTVTVSSTEPTARAAFTVAANDPWRRIPSRLTVRKPGSVNVTVYSPGRRSTME